MAKFKIPEKLIFGCVFGGTFPLLFALLTFVAWFYLDRNESHALACLLGGLAIGLVLDLKFLKTIIDKRYQLHLGFVTGIYLFYNVLIFGFFMGFPVFNLFTGFVAGYYAGQRIVYENSPPKKQNKQIHRVSLFTTLVMTSICFCSGFLALAGNGSGSDIKSMFGLGFEVTRTMIWGLVIVGGISLIGLQYALTKVTMIKTIKGNR